MLPDFTKAKEKVHDMLMQGLSRRARAYMGPFALKEYRIFEGRELATKTDDGKELFSKTQEISGKVPVKTEDIQSGNPQKVFDILDTIAQQMAQEQTKMMFRELGRICDETNQKIDFKGARFNPDMFLQTLEKVWVDFDSDGNMKNPMFVVSPKLADRVKEEMEKAEKNTEFKKKYDALVAKKREEWRARETSRKLVG